MTVTATDSRACLMSQTVNAGRRRTGSARRLVRNPEVRGVNERFAGSSYYAGYCAARIQPESPRRFTTKGGRENEH
jgi:hypothetical protein